MVIRFTPVVLFVLLSSNYIILIIQPYLPDGIPIKKAHSCALLNNFDLFLKLCAPRGPRKSDYIADIRHTGNKLNHSFKT